MDESHNDLQAELNTLRKRLSDLEARTSDFGHRPVRDSGRGRLRRLLLVGFPVALLLSAAGLLHSQGIDALFIDTLGRVGIGTTDPNTKLDVKGTITAENFNIRYCVQCQQSAGEWGNEQCANFGTWTGLSTPPRGNRMYESGCKIKLQLQ